MALSFGARSDLFQGDSMAAETSPSGMFWGGWIVSGLVILFLIFDGVTKMLRVTPVMEACARLGLSADFAVGIGAVLLACTVVYAIPQTAFLGAILLTAYLGGAVSRIAPRKAVCGIA